MFKGRLPFYLKWAVCYDSNLFKSSHRLIYQHLTMRLTKIYISWNNSERASAGIPNAFVMRHAAPMLTAG